MLEKVVGVAKIRTTEKGWAELLEFLLVEAAFLSPLLHTGLIR